MNQSSAYRYTRLSCALYICSFLCVWFDCDTIRLRRIARACFHSTRFDASKKCTYQFFVVVVS